jgi:hypothetical protein
MTQELRPFDLPADDEVLVAALEIVRHGVLRHPVAARAAFGRLVNEGRKFASTDEGRDLAERLSKSPRFARVCQTWNATTAWLLEGAAADPTLPSTLVDTLLAVAESERAATLVEVLSARGRRR